MYSEALQYLYRLRPRGVRLGVKRMQAVLDQRGNPERGIPCVHVAGTNGKGSTSAMIANILRHAGYRTGLFTSPHLHRFVERIRIDGRPISDAAVLRWLRDVRPGFEGPRAPFLTFFEMVTLLAIETFRARNCDVCVYEVGLGGRLDATNVVDSRVSVITHIDFDHMEYLGDTIPKIAREKAGIIKPGVPVVAGTRDPAARRVIERYAGKVGSDVYLLGRDFEPWLGTQRHLRGEHQHDNAGCAATAARLMRDAGFVIPERAIREGIARTRFAGRLELFCGRPDFLFDAAHNEAGARTLARYLASKPRRRTVLLFGAMRDKEQKKMLAVLAPFVDRRVYATARVSRAIEATELADIAPGVVAHSIPDAIRRARRAAGPRGLVVATGSIFLMSDVRAHVRGVRSDPLIAM